MSSKPSTRSNQAQASLPKGDAGVPLYTVAPLFKRYPHQDEPGYHGTFPDQEELKSMVQDFYRRGGHRAFDTTDQHAEEAPSGKILELWIDHHGRLMELAKLNPMTSAGRARIAQLKEGKTVGKSWELDLKPKVDEKGQQRILKRLMRTSYVDKPDHKTYVEHFGHDRDAVLQAALGDYYGPDVPAGSRPEYISNRFQSEVKRAFRNAATRETQEDAMEVDPSPAKDKEAPEKEQRKEEEEEEGEKGQEETKDPSKEEGEEEETARSSDPMDTETPNQSDFERPLNTSRSTLADETSGPPSTHVAKDSVVSSRATTPPTPKDTPPSARASPTTTKVPRAPEPTPSTKGGSEMDSPPSGHFPMSDLQQQPSHSSPRNNEKMDVDGEEVPQQQSTHSDSEAHERARQEYAEMEKRKLELERKLQALEGKHKEMQATMSSQRMQTDSRKRTRDEADGFNLTLEDGKQGLKEIVDQMRRARKLQGMSDDPDSALKYLKELADRENQALDEKLKEYSDLVAGIVENSPGSTEQDVEQARKAAMDMDNPLFSTLNKLVVAHRHSTASHSNLEKRFLSGQNVFKNGNPDPAQHAPFDTPMQQQQQQPSQSNADRMRMIDYALNFSQQQQQQPYQSPPTQQQQHQPMFGTQPSKLRRPEPSDSLGMAAARASHDQKAEENHLRKINQAWMPKMTGDVLPAEQMHSILKPVFDTIQYRPESGPNAAESPDALNIAQQVAQSSPHQFTKHLWDYIRNNPSEKLNAGTPVSGVSGVVGKFQQPDLASDFKKEIKQGGGEIGESTKWRKFLASQQQQSIW